MSTYRNTTQEFTYRAATANTVVAPADPTAFFIIEGAASKTVIVEKIKISGITMDTPEYLSVVIEKWSTAISGGTATALTKVPLDSKFDAATANTCQVYTVAPTEGTLVGRVACERVLPEDTTIVAGLTPPTVEFDFTDLDGGGVVLRGVAQGLSAAFGSDPGGAVTVGVEVQWKEV